MSKQALFGVVVNLVAVFLLLALIGAPIYFATSFTKVAGVKSTSPFLVIPQAEKFPNLKFSQQEDEYQIAFTKQGPSQVFLAVLLLNNPTETTHSYNLEVATGSARPFFGEDASYQPARILLPGTASVPISLYSGPEATRESQLVEFKITASNE